MEEKYGVIKFINKKNGEGAKGSYTIFQFEMEDGKKYTTFDSKIGEGFQAGQKVKMTGDQNGKFWNLKTMEAFEGEVPISQAAQSSPKLGSFSAEKEASIISQALTKAYCSGAPTDISKEDVWEAYAFFKSKVLENGS